MNSEIKNRFDGSIIVEAGKYENRKEAVEKNRANLYRANLHGANLDRANLHGANLHGANLDRANLDRANLYGANLENTNGAKHPLISISGSRHLFCYYNGNIQIGCEYHTVAEWLSDYVTIGKNNDYTNEQIAEYKQYIDMCAVFTPLRRGQEGRMNYACLNRM